MAATKETFIITLVAAVIAVGLNQVWNRILDASGLPLKAPRIPVWHAVAGLAVALAIGLVLFSSFFSNRSGPLDSIRTYFPWLNRAAGDSPTFIRGTFTCTACFGSIRVPGQCGPKL
jgi:hypothetical protein